MRTASKRVGLVFFPAFDWSIEPDHPEREERLLYTRDQIVEEGIRDVPGIHEYRPGVARADDIRAAHVCVPDVDEVITESHLVASGGTMTAADAVMRGEVERSFALLRPPGHHSMRIVHGSRGFCTVNNEAVMVERLRRSYGSHLRIAIVDTDAHHADGTQDIYYNDPDVLHISIHQDGRTIYPGTGDVRELGGPSAFGLTLNLPLPPGTGDSSLIYAMEQLVLPVLRDFAPDLVINAAGQDNHYTDPLTNMRVTARGYARLTELLAPHIVVLEGGYSIEGALPFANMAILLALAGLDYSSVREPDWHPDLESDPQEILEIVRKRVGFLQEMWQSRDNVDTAPLFGEGPSFKRVRRIYYDTDNIMEHQRDTMYRCESCSGHRIIESKARMSTGAARSIAAVVIPWHACQKCLDVAESAYLSLRERKDLDAVYFQDSERGRFWIKSHR